MNMNFDEFIMSGYWHGYDAWVVAVDEDGNPDVLLLGDFSREEAETVAQALFDENQDILSEVDDYLEYDVDPDEWYEQNM